MKTCKNEHIVFCIAELFCLTFPRCMIMALRLVSSIITISKFRLRMKTVMFNYYHRTYQFLWKKYTPRADPNAFCFDLEVTQNRIQLSFTLKIVRCYTLTVCITSADNHLFIYNPISPINKAHEHTLTCFCCRFILSAIYDNFTISASSLLLIHARRDYA